MQAYSVPYNSVNRGESLLRLSRSEMAFLPQTPQHAGALDIGMHAGAGVGLQRPGLKSSLIDQSAGVQVHAQQKSP